MDRYETGSRDDLIATLREQQEGWWHLAKDDLSDQARIAADALEGGDSSVRVGHTVYRVTTQ